MLLNWFRFNLDFYQKLHLNENVFFKNTNLLDEKCQKRKFGRQKVLKRQLWKVRSVKNDKSVCSSRAFV